MHAFALSMTNHFHVFSNMTLLNSCNTIHLSSIEMIEKVESVSTPSVSVACNEVLFLKRLSFGFNRINTVF